MFLDPGDGHPHAPCAAAELARRLGVRAEDLHAWSAEGCPRQDDGRFDPYAVVSWLSWGRLDRCPVLARRWQRWLAWFTARPRPRRLRVRRAQRCWLPQPRALVWWVPEPSDAPGQRVLARLWSAGEACGPWRRLHFSPAPLHAWQAEDEVALSPLSWPRRERPDLERLLCELIGSFVYAYRRHRPEERVERCGTCLDLARLLGQLCPRPWRLVCGVVAQRALEHPHFWLEVDDGTAGWIPVDPTPLAVARMLGQRWEPLLPAAIGRWAARCVRVAAARGPLGADLGGIAGRLDAEGDEALYCSDWAIGLCSWRVAAA
ncbi:MAG: hypothetical protein RMM29_02240 [Planctomycetota bacterium]|nr:hypothetical protein [Planctomycetota bacterium]MCX8040248.1 hypothetical protein [Planctomycetota bacterium]MDW8372457.1 hypothetical protein [Planctomycetota bacterium]